MLGDKMDFTSRGRLEKGEDKQEEEGKIFLLTSSMFEDTDGEDGEGEEEEGDRDDDIPKGGQRGEERGQMEEKREAERKRWR